MYPTEIIKIRYLNLSGCLIYLDLSEILTLSCGILISEFRKQIENKLMQDGNAKCEKLVSGRPIYRSLLEGKCKG